ncbi:MAG: HdeD family acid-resistance protein [Pseudomonadota bacterium]
MTQTDVTLNSAVGAEPAARTEPRPVWLIVLGTLTVLTGMAAIAFPFASTLAVEIMVASLFLAVGMFTTVHAFMEKTWKGFFCEAAIGLLHISVGIVFLANPLGGIVALTILLGAVFVAEGILRVVMGFQMRPDGRWGLMIAAGAMSVLISIFVLAGLANGASLFIIGALIGVNFIFAGVATASIGFGLWRDRRAATDMAD